MTADTHQPRRLYGKVVHTVPPGTRIIDRNDPSFSEVVGQGDIVWLGDECWMTQEMYALLIQVADRGAGALLP